MTSDDGRARARPSVDDSHRRTAEASDRLEILRRGVRLGADGRLLRTRRLAKIMPRAGAARGMKRAMAAMMSSGSCERPVRAMKGSKTKAKATETPLVELGALEECIVLRRPSVRNRSPYVADVRVMERARIGADGEFPIAVTHVPNLDSGGKLREGTRALCSRQPGVSPDTLGPHGTPKCELICRLLRCEEEENADLDDGGVWVSAHPSLVETIAMRLLERGALDDRLHPSPTVKTKGEGIKTQKMMKREVSESASNSYRPDFAVAHEDGTTTILEVKQVVDTDYSREFVKKRAKAQAPHPAYSPKTEGPYRRAGIFPWGKRGQKGPDNEKVVSARAIDHLRELTELVSKDAKVHPAVLFICSRGDVEGMRPNGAACPSFAKYLARAQRKGVRILVQKVRWDGKGNAYDAGPLELWPALEEGDEFVEKA